MSDTPRTDALDAQFLDQWHTDVKSQPFAEWLLKYGDHARQLERELVELKRAISASCDEDRAEILSSGHGGCPLAHSASSAPSRADILAEVEQRIHDCYNLQKASAWPHCEGVARAKLIVRAMIDEASSQYVGDQK